ncbi:hypothetical protein, partial [Bradyrhizobium sp. RT11b]|uniref:hypothetical protein n=1 Tax=Bradyrhizobium sp. RT11b TaxID=3156332 RepID=UPI0033998536
MTNVFIHAMRSSMISATVLPRFAFAAFWSVARRSGWEGAANWMASQCRGEVMIAAQIVAR